MRLEQLFNDNQRIQDNKLIRQALSKSKIREENHDGLYDHYDEITNREKIADALLSVAMYIRKAISKFKNKSMIASELYAMKPSEDDLARLWMKHGERGLPPTVGTDKAVKEFNQWLKELFFEKDSSKNENIIKETVELFEVSRYDDMFQFLYTFTKGLNATAEKFSDNEKVQQVLVDNTTYTKQALQLEYSVEDFIEKTRRLRKSNRIVYVLNFLKYKVAGTVLDVKENLEKRLGDNILQLPDNYEKKLLGIRKKLKPLFHGFTESVDPNSVLQQFEHFYSLDYEPIKEYDPTNKPIDVVINDLQELEQDWRDSIDEEKRLLRLEDGDEIIKSYGDGIVWVLLPRGACENEAEAMGHCGNVPSEAEGDRILSLRQEVEKGKETFYKPHLTFILDDDGFLGEMKGYGNDKPSEKYHSYIIDLLQMDIIKGIKGGGYEPHKNFQMSDLPDDVREKLVEEKPYLEPLKGYVKTVENGNPDRTLSHIVETILDEHDIEFGLKVMDDDYLYVDLDDVEKEELFDDYVKFLGEPDEYEVYVSDMDLGTKDDIIENLPDEIINSIYDYIYQALEEALENNDDSDEDEDLNDAIEEMNDKRDLKPRIKSGVIAEMLDGNLVDIDEIDEINGVLFNIYESAIESVMNDKFLDEIKSAFANLNDIFEIPNNIFELIDDKFWWVKLLDPEELLERDVIELQVSEVDPSGVIPSDADQSFFDEFASDLIRDIIPDEILEKHEKDKDEE